MFRLLRFIVLMGVIYFCFQSLNVSAEYYNFPAPLPVCEDGENLAIQDTYGGAVAPHLADQALTSSMEYSEHVFASFPESFLNCTGPYFAGNRITHLCDTIIASDGVTTYTNRFFGGVTLICTVSDVPFSAPHIPVLEEFPPEYSCEGQQQPVSFWATNYADGITGVWNVTSESFLDQPVMQTLNLELPSSGSAPSYSVDMDFGVINLGTIDIKIPEYVYGFARLFLLIGAGFTSRAIIFNA